jgi:hypothetical protein
LSCGGLLVAQSPIGRFESRPFISISPLPNRINRKNPSAIRRSDFSTSLVELMIYPSDYLGHRAERPISSKLCRFLSFLLPRRMERQSGKRRERHADGKSIRKNAIIENEVRSRHALKAVPQRCNIHIQTGTNHLS